MLTFGLRIQRATQRTRWMLLLMLARAMLPAQTAEVAGTLPEAYLPGLKPILESAVKQSPGVLLREIEIARQEANVYMADRERWPSVGGNLRYDSSQTGVSGNSSSRSRDNGFFYNASADQALYHWGAIRRTGEIARIQVAIAKKEYQEAYRLLAKELRQTYVGLVWRNARLEHWRYDLKLKEADLATLRENRDRGAASPASYAVRELDYNEALLSVERLEADFEHEKRRLARLSGMAELPSEKIPVAIPAPAYDKGLAAQLLAGILREGGMNSFQAQVAEMRVKEADLNYRIARVRLLPKFYASIAHSRESSTTASTNEVMQTAITRDTLEVRGNWTIFDGFATKGAKLSAMTEKRRWQRQLQVETEAAMDEAQHLARMVAIEARAMELAEQRRAGAEAFLKRVEEEAKAGVVSQSSIDDAVNALRFAESNAAEKRALFLSNWSEFVSRVTDDPALKNLPLSYVRTTR